MDIDTALLRRTGLFQGIEDGDIRRLLDCLHCPVRRYGRGEFLWHAGDAVPMAGIVLEGCVDAVQYGEDGGAVLTARQEKGGVFGDLLMAAGQASPLSLVASAEGAAVLFLPLEGILSDCGRGCACHVALRRESAGGDGQQILGPAAAGGLSHGAPAAAAHPAVPAGPAGGGGQRLFPRALLPSGDGGGTGRQPQRPVP